MKRLVAALTMTSYLAACTSWHVAQTAPQEAPELRITLADGTQLLLHDPRLIGDSLVGFAVPRSMTRSQRVRVALLATDLQQIQARKFDAGKTTALVVVGVGVVVGLLIALSNIQTTDPYH